MVSRSKLAARLSLESNGVLELVDPLQGWPSIMTTNVTGRSVKLAIFLGPIGLSHRNRDDEERRFQNPGQGRPILLPDGAVPLLVGIWAEDEAGELAEPVLSVADVYRRVDRQTRFSVFTPLDTLREALGYGWAETRSDTGERLTCFRLSEVRDFLTRHIPLALGDTFTGNGLARPLERELASAGLTEQQVLEDLRQTRVMSRAAARTGLAEGVLHAIYEQNGRPFLLARLPSPKSVEEIVRSLWYLQSAAEHLGVSTLPASHYDRFARNQNLTVEQWPRSAAIRRMHGGWNEACDAAGLEPSGRSPQVRFPAHRCRQFIDRYVSECVSTQVEPSGSGFLSWRAENGGPSISQIEYELGPMDEQLRSALNRVDS